VQSSTLTIQRIWGFLGIMFRGSLSMSRGAYFWVDYYINMTVLSFWCISGSRGKTQSWHSAAHLSHRESYSFIASSFNLWQALWGLFFKFHFHFPFSSSLNKQNLSLSTQRPKQYKFHSSGIPYPRPQSCFKGDLNWPCSAPSIQRSSETNRLISLHKQP
jgi:hypothetical protein